MRLAGQAPTITARLARIAGVVVGALLLLPGLYGLVGLGMVFEQWQMCQRSAAVALLGASYPADFCQTRDWLAAILPGVGLLGVGLVGIVLMVGSVRFGRAAADGE